MLLPHNGKPEPVRPPMILRVLPSLPVALLPVLLRAQTSTPTPAAAPSYEARYAEVLALAPRADRVAQASSRITK